ncbi:MAG TPA: translocation/assembly module TamB domain-containing protein, partial [Terriglobales bacterium]|nr:translocation/assembly module TamB domain-containing protein [Terriglobales bacterium]
VTRFGVSPQFDFAQYLAARAEPAALKPPDSVLNHIHLDVHLVTSPELQVQMSLARIAGNADLRLRGTVAKPVVLGRVNIVEGEVSFSGTKYRIDRGDITFTNPVTITPVLDIEASAKVRDYEVNLGVHGPLQKLSTTYRSDPPLPTPEIIALIALGRTHQDEVLSNQGQTAANVQSSNALLEQALSASQSSRIQQLFGVSRIKIDPQAGGLENNPNTQLTLEQQVSDRVTLTYLTNLSQQAQQTVQVEVQLSRSLSIVGLRDYNGVLSFAFRLRQRKR